MSRSYTVTIAKSMRGNYHISQLKYEELAVEDDAQQLTPICKAKAQQKASYAAYDVGEDFPNTFALYRDNIMFNSCDKCTMDAVFAHWPRVESTS